MLSLTSKHQCDELRPACSQCKPLARRCAYPTRILPKWQGRVVTFPLSTSSEPETGTAGVERPGDTVHSQAAEEDFDPVEVAIPPMLPEPSRSFAIQDVFLLVHFTSTTSSILLGSPSLWAKDATQLAFKVCLCLCLEVEHIQNPQRHRHKSGNLES